MPLSDLGMWERNVIFLHPVFSSLKKRIEAGSLLGIWDHRTARAQALTHSSAPQP